MFDDYLDDVIFVGNKGALQCQHLMDTFINIIEELGILLAGDKTVGPVTTLTFIGSLEINTDDMTVNIPEITARTVLSTFFFFKELHSLVGSMNFFNKVI